MKIHGSIWALLVCLLMGCAVEEPALEIDETSHHNIFLITHAYMDYCSENRKPPSQPKDLDFILTEQGHTPDKLYHPQTDQPIIVAWGTDISDTQGQSVVFAYESAPTNGRRFIGTNMGSFIVSEVEFQNSNFPAGHPLEQPPERNTAE